MGMYLHTKYQVSSIILTSFRQGGEGKGNINVTRRKTKGKTKNRPAS